ncbi:MAG: hypothetical protein N4A47_00550 [Clostridia bacterium]|jgi:putative lipase involved disintegration of autophagic bodies|nr:hypothetical protein [Clostridia bacterium]
MKKQNKLTIISLVAILICYLAVNRYQDLVKTSVSLNETSSYKKEVILNHKLKKEILDIDSNIKFTSAELIDEKENELIIKLKTENDDIQYYKISLVDYEVNQLNIKSNELNIISYDKNGKIKVNGKIYG